MTAPEPGAPPAEGEMAAVEHDGCRVAVAMLGGELHAFADTCTHAGCSLADGELDGHTVVCPCHLATFDVMTGAVVDGPAPSGLATWSVTVADGALVLGESRSPEPSGDGLAELGEAPQSARPDMDITVLVEREHGAIRRQFEALDAMARTEELSAAWTELSELLEIHASGEESLLYPKLVRVADAGAEEAEHAVRDHNEIRETVRAVHDHSPGSEGWWQALRRAREVNEEHLQEEERDALPLFRENTEKERREDLGRDWIAFHEQHLRARGLTGDDVDPDAVLDGGG